MANELELSRALRGVLAVGQLFEAVAQIVDLAEPDRESGRKTRRGSCPPLLAHTVRCYAASASPGTSRKPDRYPL